MAKSNRNVIIIASVIVLLIAGILFLNFADFSSDDNSGTLTEKEQTYTIYSEDTSDLKSVTVKTSESGIKTQNTGGKWVIDGMSEEDIDTSKAYTLASTVSTIISKNKIDENVTDFDQYGLKNPLISVIIEGKNGEINTLFIGDKSPTLGEYFIRLNDDTTVYTLYAYKVETLTKPLSYYSDFNRFSVNIDDINAIKIKRDGETVEMKIAEDIKKTVNNVWELTAPYKSSANDEYIDNNILSAIEKLSFSELAPEGGSYGLESPSAEITLTVKPYDRATGKYGGEYDEWFAVGKRENGIAYVEYGGKVYEVDEKALEFVNAPVFNILNKLQALVDINTVDKLSVRFTSSENEIEIEHGSDDISFKFNGAEADYKTTRGIYQAVISLAVDGIYKGEPLGEVLLELEFDGIKDSDDVEIEFKSINDLSCALVRNGKAEFTIKKNKISELETLWNEYVKSFGKEG